jgi:hypothetical protein
MILGYANLIDSCGWVPEVEVEAYEYNYFCEELIRRVE